MKKSTTYSENPQHWATESLLDNIRPMTNLYSQHTQVRYTPPTTGFARRALLLLAFLVIGLGSVWGVTIKESATANETLSIIVYVENNQSSYSLPIEIINEIQNKFSSNNALTGGWNSNIYVRWSAKQNNERIHFDGIWGSGFRACPDNINSDGWTYTVQDGYCIYGLVKDAGLSVAQVLGTTIYGGQSNGEDHSNLNNHVIEYYISNKAQQIRDNTSEEPDIFDMKVEITFIPLPPDEFLGEAKNPNSPNAKGSFSKEFDDENIGTYTFTLDGVYSNDIKYARIVLCDATGKAIDYDANILKVTYNGEDAKSAGSRSTNGVYVYDDGQDLTKSNISITLSAGSGMMNQYSVKCLLSTGTMESGETKEPDWDYEYTYSFTYPIPVDTEHVILDLSNEELQKDFVNITFHDNGNNLGFSKNNIWEFFNKSDEQLGGNWYAHWYVVEDVKKLSSREPIASTTQALDDIWVVNHQQVSNQDSPNWPTDNWKVSDNMVWSDNIVNGLTEWNNNDSWPGWYFREIFANQTKFFVPKGKTVDDFGGYKIVLEITDENTGGAPNNPPAVKRRFIFEIPESDQFLNKEKTTIKEGTGSKDIPKSNTSASFTLNEVKNSGYTQDVKYARIQLCDTKGKVLEYDENLLTVTYKGNVATKAGRKQKNGVYVYENGNKLDLSEVNITLNAGFGNLNKYTIKCLLSTDEMPNTAKEPELDYKYTYWFNYIIETEEFPETVAWKQNGMMPIVSTTDLNDWNTSWEELSLGIYAKWYVVESNSPDEKEVLGAYQGSRVENTWTIDPTRFDVSDNEAVQKDKSTLTSTFMSTIYAPADMEFDNAKNYQIIFEIYTYNNISLERNPAPNARYIFTLYDDFLGELTDKDKSGSRIKELDNKGITEYPLSLAEATTAYSAEVPGHADIKFARVWLTRADGTLVDPTDRLLIEGMNLYGNIEETDPTFGYYLIGDNLILGNATLKLPLATYNQYQVHVALSTGTDFDIQKHEPDYDYLFTFSFSYPAKTKYKTLIYDAQNNQCKPHLLQNWMEVAGDCNEGLSNLNDKLYVRWYLVDIASKDVIQLGGAIDGYQQANNLGYYKLGGFNFATGNYKHTLNDGKIPIPTITLPDDYKGMENYKKVQLVCVATTKTDDYNTNPSWVADPSEIQVKYVYTLKTEEELQIQPFVHYQGEAYRYQIDMLGMTENSAEAKKFDYISNGTSPDQNYTWDISKNEYVQASGNIRQNVHTVDYYYYVNNTDSEVELKLPLQYYDITGDDTEPKAYYRWYDYNTDKATDYLKATGKLLNMYQDTQLDYKVDDATTIDLTHKRIYFDESRGLFALNIARNDLEVSGKTLVTNPSHKTIGVTFNATQAFANSEKEVVIACDVSRYLDGMDESFTYLVHEPTLSVRYLFHILPTNEIVEKINKVGSLANVENTITGNSHPTGILEYEGRIVVSTNDGVGDFSLRTQLNDLKQYYIDENTPATRIWWYAYYKDIAGNWWRHLVEDKDYLNENNETVEKSGRNVRRSEMHQDKYSLEDLNGTWTQISGAGGTAPTIEVGDRVQMVACIGTGETANTTNDKPIIWMELEFIDAKPMALGTETDERSEGSMNREYGDPTVLDFNEFSLLGTTKPTNSYENYATVPLEFGTAQYGFSYPQLYGLCATNWTTNWDGYGISPLHGDYILLKSMNMPGISFDENWNEQSIFCNWWNSNSQQPLLDVTNERANGKFVTEGEDYGGFLYVDAADEARTIATLEFDAALCHSAKIYYTAYIASMTGFNDDKKDDQTPPMLRFRVTTYDEEKQEYVPVVTFVTGDIQQEVRADDPNSFKQSQWYQVYGYTTIPSELDYLLRNGDPRTYYVEIDNYCDNTNGADYCVDQISFYTTNTKLRVRQVGKQCGDEDGVSLNIYVSADDISDLDENTIIYWRIYDADNDKVVDDPDLYNNGGKLYGQTPIGKLPEVIPSETSLGEYGYFKRGGSIYFSLAKRLFDLKDGNNYYISVFAWSADFDADNSSGWGNPDDKCTVFSPLFVPKAMYLSAEDGEGNAVPSVDAGCGNQEAFVDLKMALYLPDDSEESGFHKYTDVHFDYFRGTRDEFLAYTLEEDETISLFEAVLNFRGKELKLIGDRDDIYSEPPGKNYSKTAYATSAELPEDYKAVKDGKYYNIIKKAMDEGLLYLSCSSNIKLPIEVDYPTVLALPTEDYVMYGGDRHEVCSPLVFTFDVNTIEGAPQMALGFDDVDYPEGYEKQVVRVGLEQLKMMKGMNGNSNYKLHIPVRSYNDKNQENTSESKLYFPNDFNYLTISAVEKTTDPILKDAIGATAVGKKFAKIEPVVANESPYVNNDRMYLSLDLSECEIDFHEGYEYEVSTSFIDAVDVNVDKPCMGDLFLVIKVVPEFVTWNSQTNGNANNVNWNRDDNWKRSSCAELYKSEDGTQNTTTTAQGGIYQNNDKMGLDNVPNTYVPMKFSYVTLLENCHAPYLIKMEVESTGSDKTGGTLLSGDLATVTSPKSETGKSEATDFIKYDMLVRYGKHEDGGEGCFGHRKITGKDSNGKDTWADVGESELEDEVFDVEKFYGNICKEIYFKPAAELVHQHYLAYEKAWVEKELVANKWYLMSTPLRETYAGDMYVPASDITDYSLGEPKDVKGRQVTEVFQPIKMTNDEGTLLSPYSRTKYPIYQRSWGMKDGKVYTQTADTYRSDYSANLGYTTWSGNMVEWGHAFNDVDVPYTKRSAFSIRVHKEDQTGKALIRLPKDDINYLYYDYNSDKQDGATSTFMKKSADIGRFVTEMNDADITLQILDAQQMDGYVLVGNPYVASLDMEAFFRGNTVLEKAYYTYEYDEDEKKYKVTTYSENDLGIIRPLEAFFVKANSDIVFTDNMMTDGNAKTATQSRTFALTAANTCGQSTATVTVGEEAKSVETLFDSNLADVPMVYTVADGQAVSVNQVTGLDRPIAFGVTCVANDEPVDVTFSDVAQLTSGEVYVVDAVTGEQTSIAEGSTVSVQPNDYGRYFLQAGTLGIREQVDVQQGIMVSVRGRVVTVTSGEALTAVRAVVADGTMVHQATGGGTTTSFTLATPGVYVVKAENAIGEQQTVKVIVK